MKTANTIDTLSLFPLLDHLLIELLGSLTDEEWQTPTIAKLWKVKDIAAHLLDGNIRGLSISRDGYYGEVTGNIHTYEDLVAFLNNMNLSWTMAAKRLSPKLLLELLTTTGKEYIAHLHTLQPLNEAVFPVAWAGQSSSPNWFHIAREYTEKFLHQQQIRDALNKQGLMTKQFYYPFLDTCMHALPHTFRDVAAANGTTVSLIVSGDAGGQWNIVKSNEEWVLNKEVDIIADARVAIDPGTAWKLFSKSRRPEEIMDTVEITGDQALGKQALQMVAVMA